MTPLNPITQLELNDTQILAVTVICDAILDITNTTPASALLRLNEALNGLHDAFDAIVYAGGQIPEQAKSLIRLDLNARSRPGNNSSALHSGPRHEPPSIPQGSQKPLLGAKKGPPSIREDRLSNYDTFSNVSNGPAYWQDFHSDPDLAYLKSHSVYRSVSTPKGSLSSAKQDPPSIGKAQGLFPNDRSNPTAEQGYPYHAQSTAKPMDKVYAEWSHTNGHTFSPNALLERRADIPLPSQANLVSDWVGIEQLDRQRSVNELIATSTYFRTVLSRQ
ncbi:hypothetical protein K461DRAFT_316641 [Myriangium duriaei CBS 260.36]|uniref:Uncharacterized protein n=1 Tax=Myriangium duriaei CBS 260.36 TaxID=1168546 RepID=A0A9P4IPK7_9PEZI|nr:hypothetical protein K461DRAFT_316641 [Myriangium duriaei CBS 260.36]